MADKQDDEAIDRLIKGSGYIDPIGTFLNVLSLSKKQKFNLLLSVTSLPALTAMIFIRRKLGYRLLKPSRFIGMAIFIAFLPEIVSSLPAFVFKAGKTASGESVPLIVFAVVMVVFALWQKRQRWKGFVQGELWHSYSTGISRFSFLPMGENFCNRFVDPAVCFIIGLVATFTFSGFLGYWLMFSGFCLLHYEQANYELGIDKLLDTLDGICDAEAESKHIAFYASDMSQETGKPAVLSREQTAGIPTGLAPDIEAQIQRRKNRKPLSDDLV